MLTPILIVKLICEIALCSLVGRGILVLMSAGKPQGNVVYALFCTLTQPFVSLVAWFTPRFVLPRHHPLAAFLLLAVVWLAATLAKVHGCLQIGTAACR